MDETTDKGSVKQCAFTVIYVCPNTSKVLTKFFDIVETSTATADQLYNCLKKAITEKVIPLNNLVGYSSDTTNVMFGSYNSVYTHLKNELLHIVAIRCSCHLIHLSTSKA